MGKTEWTSINDRVTLNNGTTIPCVGYGTWLTENPQAFEVVSNAIKAGYRHIDTAKRYGNEEGVGRAIRESGVPREEMFITSKVWNTERGYDQTLAAFDRTLELMGLDYLDLYLIHWPANYTQFGDGAKELNEQTWKAMETIYRSGRAKAIGVCNYMVHHLKELLAAAEIKPMVDQVEFHPGWNQRAIVKFCKEQGIAVEAWSPLGRRDLIDNPLLNEIGAKYGKSSAQLCLRWIIEKGIIPLPKTATPSRMLQNQEIFDFELTPEDTEIIDKLECIGGQCARPDDVLF